MNILGFFAFFTIIFYVLQIYVVHGLTCENIVDASGRLSSRQNTRPDVKVVNCWILKVPINSYANISIKGTTFSGCSCANMYVKLTVAGTNDTYKICEDDKKKDSIIAFADVNITHSHIGYSRYYYDQSSGFDMDYHIENITCRQEKHFRCSKHECIQQHQVCDGVKDCGNGADEDRCVRNIMGVVESRENAIISLKNRLTDSFDWGKNTHRAITALYLGNGTTFSGNNVEEEVVIKEMELQTAVTLLRDENSTDAASVTQYQRELSMLVNALTVTCHDPRKFFGYDLLQTLRDNLVSHPSSSPAVYLALCNSNGTMSESDVRKLLTPLLKGNPYSTYPYLLDVQALSIMALTCIKEKTNLFKKISSVTKEYEKTINNFIAAQNSDGSFGNMHTTALVAQALIASKQETNKEWNTTATAQYLFRHVNSSSVDFLLLYYALPVLASRSLLDVSAVNCNNFSRKLGDGGISDEKTKVHDKMRINYSLYVGNQKNAIHTIFLRVPINSTVLDVMEIGQKVDPKYKFQYKDISDGTYVYEIAGITNDVEVGNVWQLYTEDTKGNITYHTESPKKFILKEDDHLIIWYRTIEIL